MGEPLVEGGGPLSSFVSAEEKAVLPHHVDDVSDVVQGTVALIRVTAEEFSDELRARHSRHAGDLPGQGFCDHTGGGGLGQQAGDRHDAANIGRQFVLQLHSVMASSDHGVHLTQSALTEGISAGEHTHRVERGEAELLDELHLVAAGCGIKKEHGGVGVDGGAAGLLVAVDKRGARCCLILIGEGGQARGINERVVAHRAGRHPPVNEGDVHRRGGQGCHLPTHGLDRHALAVAQHRFRAIWRAVLVHGDHVRGFQRLGLRHGGAHERIEQRGLAGLEAANDDDARRGTHPRSQWRAGLGQLR